MHTPTSDQVLTVINNFKKVLPKATLPNHLDMMESDVNISYECGTIHCHAGWYAVAACDIDKELNYVDGARQIAKDLGFILAEELKEWAEENPLLWGNTEGEAIFVGRNAFKSESRPEGAKTLQDIIDHWEEVRQRIMQIENKEKEHQ